MASIEEQGYGWGTFFIPIEWTFRRPDKVQAMFADVIPFQVEYSAVRRGLLVVAASRHFHNNSTAPFVDYCPEWDDIGRSVKWKELVNA